MQLLNEGDKGPGKRESGREGEWGMEEALISQAELGAARGSPTGFQLLEASAAGTVAADIILKRVFRSLITFLVPKKQQIAKRKSAKAHKFE